MGQHSLAHSVSRVGLPVRHLLMLRGSWSLRLQATPGLHVTWVTKPWWTFEEAEQNVEMCQGVPAVTLLVMGSWAQDHGFLRPQL